MEPRTEARWRDVCDRWDSGRGYVGLSTTEKVWLNIRSLIDSIENGGLISYFYNSGADTLSDCLEALQRLGADRVAQQVHRVARLFGKHVPTTVELRNRIINSWPDDDQRYEVLEDVDHQLMPMIRNLETELDAFLRHEGLAN